MNAIDSPLEALAINYAVFGFNHLWTWLALLTAAFSLWKICTKPHLSPPLPSNDRSLSESQSKGDERPVQNFVLNEAPVTSAPAAGLFSAGDGGDDVDGVTKGKFTVYYEKDDEWESDIEELSETETGACCNDVCGCESEWWEEWDKMLEMRLGVKEWYMCQDLTDLNGNVVRFWDSRFGNGGFLPKELRYSSSCAVR